MRDWRWEQKNRGGGSGRRWVRLDQEGEEAEPEWHERMTEFREEGAKAGQEEEEGWIRGELPAEVLSDRHAPPQTLRVSAGRVVRALAGGGQRGVLRAGADPAVSRDAVEHDQDAQPPPPQHAGQRGAGHRAVRGAAG